MLSHQSVTRVLVHLLLSELERSRRCSYRAEASRITPRSRITRHSAEYSVHLQAVQRQEAQSGFPSLSEAPSDESFHYDADSLEILMLAARVNEFFHLHEAGIEDNLLHCTTVKEWSEVVQQSLAVGTSGITVQTSGSTGEPKRCTHLWQTLAQEVKEIARILQAEKFALKRVVACVPPHHIYGFIWTVLLPEMTSVPVVDALALSPFALYRTLKAGDVVVSFPSYWQYLSQSWSSALVLDEGMQAVTSTAPCPATLKQRLIEQGFSRVIEVYGSSETGGVGVRLTTHKSNMQPEDADDVWFETFSFGTLRRDTDRYTDEASSMIHAAIGERVLWHRAIRGAMHGSEALVEKFNTDDNTGTSNATMQTMEAAMDIPLMDVIALHPTDSRRFKPLGRIDGMVQVGGVNVSPAAIAERLSNLDGVQACVIRLMRPEEGTRLKAFIVPTLPEGDLSGKHGAAEAVFEATVQRLRPRLEEWIRKHLPAPEQPVSLTFGVSLPVSVMDKPADW